MPPSPTLSLKRLRPVYVLAGDETYTRDLFRAALAGLIAPELREVGVVDEDLSTTPLERILDAAASPSLLAPLQLYFVHGAKELFGRVGAGGTKKKHGDFPANLRRFVETQADGTPWAALVFIADHLHIPVNRARISLDDKSKLQRIEEAFAGLAEFVYCAQATPVAAATLARELAAARSVKLGAEEASYLAELLDANLGRIASEVEKLCLNATPGGSITTSDIRSLVSASGQSSVYELADQVSRSHRPGSLECVRRIWDESGDEGAIGLCFQLSRIYKMALVVRQARARDARSVYAVLPEGLRPPGFAVDTVLAASRMQQARLELGIRLLHEVDVGLRSSPPSPRILIEQLVLALTGQG